MDSFSLIMLTIATISLLAYFILIRPSIKAIEEGTHTLK